MMDEGTGLVFKVDDEDACLKTFLWLEGLGASEGTP
jgi:hypothetical protein